MTSIYTVEERLAKLEKDMYEFFEEADQFIRKKLGDMDFSYLQDVEKIKLKLGIK